MDIKNKISKLKQENPALYESICSLVDVNNELRNDFDTLISKLKLPDVAYGHNHVPKQVRVRKNTDQLIATGAGAGFGFAISFVATDVKFDTDLMWVAANPTRIVFKTPGRYIVGGCIQFELPGAANIQQLHIVLNGATCIVHDMISTRTENVLKGSALYEFARDDYIELYAQQASGAGLLALAIFDYGSALWACMTERSRNKNLVTENFVAGDF